MRGGWERLVCFRLRTYSISPWGRRFDAVVRIMSHLPSGILIGRRFLVKHAMVIDFGRLTGSFMQNVQGKPVRFSGKILLDDCEQVEESAVVEEADVESEIRALELSDLGDEAENMRQVLLKHQDVFKCLGFANGEEFKIQVTEGIDIDKLDCPPRRRSEKERLLEEIEVQNMLDLGVLAPSSAAASTNNVVVNKKTTDSAGNVETHTATDHRRLNTFTKNNSYSMPSIDDIVNWLSTKKYFSTLDLRCGYWEVKFEETSRKLTAAKTALVLWNTCAWEWV
jgi:hypothetical protein